MRRIHVFLTGQVQGVGLRRTAQQIGRSLRLTGWVRNLPDGRVELVAEGAPNSLERFLDQLEERFQIAEKVQQEERAKDQWDDFVVWE